MATSEAISNPFAPLTNQPPPPPQPQQQPDHPLPPPAKKKRNLPGTPDPEAEVIALSPRTLMATNRFVCEICGKGFQRDQNLQLHRRGHNLPWKLRQRSGKEARKRVYVCPERSCVHHNPARALGDLTGIKKHFCRKHGEKKWKCDKCSKRYAVQSDWKAHSKTCGTREYRCDCGTLFSRRDSFITHRAFCDALAEETARLNAASSAAVAVTTSLCGQSYLFGGSSAAGMVVRPDTMLPPAAAQLKAASQSHSLGQGAAASVGDICDGGLSLWGVGGDALHSMGHIGALAGGGWAVPPQLYADLFSASSAAPPLFDPAQLSWLYGSSGKQLSSSNAGELTSAAKEADCAPAPSVFSGQQHAKQAAAPTDMSATALLQKAAQIGAVVTSGAASVAMPLVGAFEPAKSSAPARPIVEECGKFDGGAALFGDATSQHNASISGAISEFTAAAGSMPYDVLSAVRHAGLKVDAAVGREETRDFLGVGVQALCSSSINGWI